MKVSESSQREVRDERRYKGERAESANSWAGRPVERARAYVRELPGERRRADERPRLEKARMRIVPGVVPAAPASPPRQKTGAGQHVVILVENLPVPFDRRPWQIARTLVEEGYRVSVICPKMYEYTRAHERLEGVEIYRYPNREGDTPIGWIAEYLNAMFWMMWICLKLFFTRGIDAIHACNPPDLLFGVAWPFKVFFRTRFLFDHHDLNPEVYLAKFGRKDWLYRLMCRLECMTYRLADVALATNKSFKHLAATRDCMKKDRVYIVRNAPMPGRFVQGRPKADLRFGKDHLIAYLGVMNKQDGLDLLLESIAHVVHHHERKDVVFGLIGDGPEVPALKERAKELGLNGEVKFLGRMSDGKRISEYLNTASVCVCPDPKNEMNDHSTMTKVVEYMALGRPIVAYDLQETVYSAGDCALYAANNDPRRFADRIVELLEDPKKRQMIGISAKERYDAMLSWERSQEQLRAAYQRLFDPRHEARPL